MNATNQKEIKGGGGGEGTIHSARIITFCHRKSTTTHYFSIPHFLTIQWPLLMSTRDRSKTKNGGNDTKFYTCISRYRFILLVYSMVKYKERLLC